MVSVYIGDITALGRGECILRSDIRFATWDLLSSTNVPDWHIFLVRILCWRLTPYPLDKEVFIGDFMILNAQ